MLEIIREKDQTDFRGVRGDFASRAGGGSIEVCLSCGHWAKESRVKVVGRTSSGSLTLSKLFRFCFVCAILRGRSLLRVGPRTAWDRRPQ